MPRKTLSEPPPYTQAQLCERFMEASRYLVGKDYGWFMPVEPRRNMDGRPVDVCHFKGGAVRIKWRGQTYLAARMVWFMQTGHWPQNIGCKNHNAADIRFENLFVLDHADISDLV